MNDPLEYSKILKSDLFEILTFSEENLQQLRARHVVILGGTGFVGKWLVTSLLEANLRLKLGIKLTLVTRSAKNAERIFNSASNHFLELLEIDLLNVKDSELPRNAEIYVHAATPSVPETGSLNSSGVRSATFHGAEIIEAALHESSSQNTNVIHLSSGAVYSSLNTDYGMPKPEVELDRDTLFESDYAATKLETEFRIKNLESRLSTSISNPRLFAFAGPHLALDQHFAVGNFMKDALRGQDVILKGHPDTVRSYMYPTDLVKVLIHLMVYPNSNALNVGSPYKIRLGDLAQKISRDFGNKKWQAENFSNLPNTYYPQISGQNHIIDQDELVSIDDSLRRWHSWIRSV